MELQCHRHHAETALKEAVKRRKPFETTCHAGVTELVFPIITGNCRGALFAVLSYPLPERKICRNIYGNSAAPCRNFPDPGWTLLPDC